MNADVSTLSNTARRAARAGDWPTVTRCARKILKDGRNDAEGHFLEGLAQAGRNQPVAAARSFQNALRTGGNRYDAAIELMRLSVMDGRHAEAHSLLDRFEAMLSNSPYYLEMAADTCTRMGLHERAWSLYRRACELQPRIDRFQERYAASSVLVGRVEEARDVYRRLIARHPRHQRNHYELAKLGTATDDVHVRQMIGIIDADELPHEKNIFLYYALAKELEDLGRWDEAFDYLRLGGDAAKSASGYDVRPDVQLIERYIEVCTADWLGAGPSSDQSGTDHKIPVFVVGLPRTGTTLVERIIASHSQVQSIDETHFVEMSMKKCTGISSREYMNAEIFDAAARIEPRTIADCYMEFVAYRLEGRPYFIDKYPENFSYLGLIARAFPEARIVQVLRHPMDACFAMYKQSYFRYAYTLEDLGQYYVSYRKLRRHWETLLGDRIISIEYESLVSNQEAETRMLLERLGLPFDENCLKFHESRAPSATASTVQVREKVHRRSVGRWKNFAKQLEPLRQELLRAQIDVS